MTIRSGWMVLGCALSLAACGESTPATPAVTVSPAATAPAAAPAAAAAAAGAAAAGAAAAAVAAVAPAAVPVALAGPGFTATPVGGTAGGPVPGETLSADCIGNFPAGPQHTLTVGAAIPMLRVLVNAGPTNDTTLAIRRPDGTYACNDDSGDPGNGFNPVVELANAAPGEYQIFVGGYSMGDTWASYNLTFSEAADAVPSTAAPNP